MLASYSLSSIVLGQIKTICADNNGLRKIGCLAFFFGLPLVSPVVQFYFKLHLDKDIVSIIISAASIFAGLLLNLLVIVYSIAPEQGRKEFDAKSQGDLLKTIELTFYNISYAIACSLVLVVFSLGVLTQINLISRVCELFVYYLGAHLLLAIVLVLQRCHSLMEYRLTKKGGARARVANETWGK